MAVEVTMHPEPKQKSCWFPFKKQIESRRCNRITFGDEAYDYDGVDWSNGDRPPARTGKRPLIVNNTSETTQSFQSQSNNTYGSVSTGTDISSYGDYSSNDSSPNRSNVSQMHNLSSQSCTTDDNSITSYDTRYNSVIETAFLMSQNGSVARTESIKMEMIPEGLSSEFPLERNDDLFPKQLAMVETNCMAQKFWVDEVVEGGAFACLQQRTSGSVKTPCVTSTAKEVDNTLLVQMKPWEKESIWNFNRALATQDFKDVKAGNDQSLALAPNQLDKRIQKSLQAIQHVNPSENISGIKYVSQKPEDINIGPPLRRAFCANLRLQKLKNGKYPPTKKQEVYSSIEPSFLNGSRRSASYYDGFNSDMDVLPPLPAAASPEAWNQTELMSTQYSPSSVECLNKPCSGKQLSVPQRNDQADEMNGPNFYVEVEAMQEQLNGIRDLEDIEAEDKQLDEDIGMARTSSLVDGDSTFMESVFEDDSDASEIQEQRITSKSRKIVGENDDKNAWSWKRKSSNNFKMNARTWVNDSTKNAKVLHSSSRDTVSPVRQAHPTQIVNPCISPILEESSQKNDYAMAGLSKIPSRPQTSSIPSSRYPSGDLSISQRVEESREVEKQGKESMTSMPVSQRMASAAAKYYQRRQALGLTQNESSGTPPSTSSLPIDQTRSLAVSSSMSFDSFEVYRKKISSHQRESPGNHRLRMEKLMTLRHYLGYQNVAKETYFGGQHRREAELIHSGTHLGKYDVYGNESRKTSHPPPSPQMSRESMSSESSSSGSMSSAIPNFDDDFWKDDDTSEIKSAAFEEYDGDDSLFGDLRSASESNDSERAERSQMSHRFDGKLGRKGSIEHDQIGHLQESFESTRSRADVSIYTGKSEYTASEDSRYMKDFSRYTVSDESRYKAGDASNLKGESRCTGDTSKYTTDSSRFSTTGETSFLSTSQGSVSSFVDENDGELVAALDRWLYY